MVTRKLIRVTSPEAAALAAKETSQSSSAPAEDSTTVNKQPTKLLTNGKKNKNETGGGKKRDVSSEDIISGRKVKKRQRVNVDLSDVPPQLPILKNKGRLKEGASRYVGVHFEKPRNKWRVQITIDGKQRTIGDYEDEEAAAIDYARAVFKCKGEEALAKLRERKSSGSGPAIDLSGVPPQHPIPKSKGNIKEGASKYTGVYFNKASNKWTAGIKIEGKRRHIGCYDNEEEAAIDCARAVFKYNGQGALDKARQRKSSAPAINIELNHVPSIPPILKSEGNVGEGSSKYSGVSFEESKNKWQAQIIIEGKQYSIGYYENEVFVAIDYARAVLKYQGQRVLDKARGLDSVFKNTHTSTTQSTNANNDEENGGGKKRALPLESGGSITSREIVMKRIKFHLEQKQPAPAIDLRDVPPQLPILKNEDRIKVGSSKYIGVSFDKRNSKWQAQIMIDGKVRRIGYYENEEEEAADDARAVLKCQGQRALDKAREPKKSSLSKNGSDNEKDGGKKRAPPLPSEDAANGNETSNERQKDERFEIDLTDVPPQQPIHKCEHHVKEGSSKYTGVCFDKAKNKWKAQIKIDGKQRNIGYYDKEEESAANYARAVFKCNGQEALDKERERASARGLGFDLSDVPPQLPILKSEGNIKGGTSKYVGVNFDKSMSKWKAAIRIDRKLRHIGYYENEEEAAIDYARALFKFKSQDAVDKAREQNKQTAPAIDLSDVPSQLPILKSKERVKEGASKYTGVSFDKSMKKWKAVIIIEGKTRHVGLYKNEEEAAIDYARALFKYKGQDALDKARGQKSLHLQSI